MDAGQAFLDATPDIALQSELCAHRYMQKMTNSFGKKVAARCDVLE